MDVGLCESKSFLSIICRQPRFLSGVLVFEASCANSFTDKSVADITTNDVPNLTSCQERSFTGSFNHSIVFPFRCFASAICSHVTDASFASIRVNNSVYNSLYCSDSSGHLTTLSLVCTGARGGTRMIPRDVLKRKPTCRTRVSTVNGTSAS